METGAIDFLEKTMMWDDVERFAEVDAQQACSRRRLWVIEATRDAVSERHKSGDARSLTLKTMLMGRGRERRFETRQDETLENFNCRAEEANWTIRRPLIGRFVRFEDGNDVGASPNRRKIRPFNRKVKEEGQVLDTQRPEMLEVKYRQIVGTGGG